MSAAKHQDVEDILLGISQEVFRAIRLKDVASLGRFLADDFVHRSPDGSESSKTDFLLGVSGMPVDVVSISGEHQRVDVFGESAVLTGVQRAEWRQGDDAQGISSVAFTDVFARRAGKWLMVLAYGVEME